MGDLKARNPEDHRLILPLGRAAWTLRLRRATSREGDHNSIVSQARDLNIKANSIEEGDPEANDLDGRAAFTSR